MTTKLSPDVFPPRGAPPTRPAQWPPARRHASTEYRPVPSAPPAPHFRLAGGLRPGGTSLKPDSGHVGTINLTARMRWTSQNAMKPRIQCVPTQWIPGFMASGSRPMQYRVATGGATGAKAAPVSSRAVLRFRHASQRQAPTAVLGAGPGQFQRQLAGAMLRPTSLRPTSRRTGFRAPGGAGVRPGTGGLGSRCPERRPEQCRGQRPPGRRPRCAPRGGYCPCGRRRLPDCCCPRVRRSRCRRCAGRCPCGGNAPARRPCPPMRASPVRASPVRAERECPTRRSAGPRGARPRPRRWPR